MSGTFTAGSDSADSSMIVYIRDTVTGFIQPTNFKFYSNVQGQFTGSLIDDEIETTSLPRLQTGMRDMNAVMSSSFVVGKSLIEDTRTKMVAKFSADLKYRLIPIAQERWNTHLNWNKLTVGTYAEIMKLYFSAKTDVDEINYAMAAKNTLWPFTVLDFERAAVGALQGATTSKQDVAGASTASRVLRVVS